METKDVKPLLGTILAKLEAARQREEDVYAAYIHVNEGDMPHEVIVAGRESGLAKAIRIVKDELKALEDKRRERQ